MLDMVMDARRWMVCRTCAGPGSPAAVPERTVVPTRQTRRKYACAACNYRFSSARESPRCPYCGSTGVDDDLKSSAAALLRSSGFA